MVKQGHIAADIARTLNMKKSHVSYYVTKAKGRGYIKEVTRDACAILELTQAGSKFLDRYTQSLTQNNNNTFIPICRLENMQFKAKILRMPTIPVDWKKIEVHNWTQYDSQVDNIRVRLNLADPPTLLLIPSPIDGNNPNDLIITLVYECINALLELHRKIGLKVDKLEPCSRAEWCVYDPIAKASSKNNGQVTIDGVGKVNASPPRHAGEFEFHDPRALVDYLAMPKRVRNIEAMLEKAFNNSNPNPDCEPSYNYFSRRSFSYLCDEW